MNDLKDLFIVKIVEHTVSADDQDILVPDLDLVVIGIIRGVLNEFLLLKDAY